MQAGSSRAFSTTACPGLNSSPDQTPKSRTTSDGSDRTGQLAEASLLKLIRLVQEVSARFVPSVRGGGRGAI